MLQRLEQEPDEDWDDLDSDDDEIEAADLADRLAEVDLNNADAVWERLTDEEKQEFKSIVYNGEIEKIVQSVEPWWTQKLPARLIRDVKEESARVREILKLCPKATTTIKDFKTIATKPPAPCIAHNIANVFAAYTFIVRYYNSDHSSYELEAADNFIAICDNLKTNANFESVASAVDSVIMNCLNASLFSDLNTKDVLRKDLREIFDGPGDDEHQNSFLLSALSDVVSLFKSAKQKYKKEAAKDAFAAGRAETRKFSSEFLSADGRTEFKQLENQTHFAGCIRKLEFYLSFVKFRYSRTEWPVEWETL